MKTYNYTARSAAGGKVSGVAEANSRDEAVRSLRDQGMFVESIEETRTTLGSDVSLSFLSKGVDNKDLSVLSSQFAILLHSGLPMVRAVQLIGDQTENKALKKILATAADDVAAGNRLADSFEKSADVLPTTFIESVRAGEEAGSLEAVFERLKDYYDKSSRTAQKVRSAMMYPTFVIIIAIAVVAVLMVFAIPTFSSQFASLGLELPLVTRVIIGISDFFVNFWWVILIIILALAVGVNLAKRNEAFRTWWSALGLRVPIIGRINLMSGAAQYAGTMGVMMSSGLPMVRSVAITARSMSNYFLSRSLASTTLDLEAGKPLASCLQKEGTLPELAIEMTSVGEQTGSLEDTMVVLSEYYDNEVETSTDRALSILEPAIIVVLAVIVFALLLSVYLPLFTMYGGMQANLY